ncbi:MAG: hypothetical protein AAGA58_13700 [Verrucomicrobiota bacterium]
MAVENGDASDDARSSSQEFAEAEAARLSEKYPPKFSSPEEWSARRDEVLRRLKSETFGSWPDGEEKTKLKREQSEAREGVRFSRFTFKSDEHNELLFFLAHRDGLEPGELDLVVLNVLGEVGWREFLSGIGGAFPAFFPEADFPDFDEELFQSEARMHKNMKWGMAYLPPRGIGPTAEDWSLEHDGQIDENLVLLGLSVESLQVWDIRQGLRALRSLDGMDAPNLWFQASGKMAANTLYASLYEEGLYRVDLHDLPVSHREGPVYPGILGITDLPEVAAIAAERTRLILYTAEPEAWSHLESIGELLGWEKRFQLREPVE